VNQTGRRTSASDHPAFSAAADGAATRPSSGATRTTDALRGDGRANRRRNGPDGDRRGDAAHPEGSADGRDARTDGTARVGAPTDIGPLRIGDVAARIGVSTRTLRYYEELGLLTPSGYTAGGERRYEAADLRQLERILELKMLLGMNLEEVKATLASQVRLDELRAAYRADDGTADEGAQLRRRAILAEALQLRTDLITRMDEKISRMEDFREQLAADADRCRALLEEFDRTETPTRRAGVRTARGDR
jgi:DNA-binding transcriptional MerR regulator